MALFYSLNVCRASKRRYFNVSKRTPIIKELAAHTSLALLHFNLGKGDVKVMSDCTLQMLQIASRTSKTDA